MSDKLRQAIEQEELKQVLSQHAYAYFKEGDSVASVIEKLTSLNNNADFPLDSTEVEEIVKEKSKKSNNTNNNKDNTIYTSYLETSEFILEEVLCSPHPTRSPHLSQGSSPKFIKYSKLDGTFEEVEEFFEEDLVYKPIVDDLLTKKGINLPTGVAEYKDTAEIIKEIKEFIHEGAELPLLYENLFPYLTLFYWVYERFPFIPYVQFVGGTGTGKTTAMEVFGSLCYKSIDTTGSLTISSIFRLATAWKGTLLIDEFESVGEQAHEMVSFLKSGVSDRLVFRSEAKDSKRFDVKAYTVKAPKLFTSEKPIEDAGLQSRTIVVEMEKNTRKIPLYKLPKFYEKANLIRNKLLLWRLRNLNKIDLSEIEYGFPELEVFDRRVQQIITPIYYFSDDAAKQEIQFLAKSQEDETLRQRRESDEGKIFEIIVEEYNRGVAPTLSTIVNYVNKDRKIQMHERGAGEIVRKILGFDIKRTGTGANKESIVLVDTPNAIEHLKSKAQYYGISISGVAYD